jgi:integrase
MTALASTMQAFFTDRLLRQRHASSQTVAAYRDTMRLLLAFAQAQTGKPPCELDFDSLDAELVSAFLDHLEQERGNSVRTRNARLAAIRSLYQFAALRHPEHSALIGRCSRFHPSATTSGSSPTSPTRRPKRCWSRRTERRGLVAAITRCCWSRSKQACAPPS